MPVSSALETDPAIVGPLGGLLLSVVRVGSPMLALRSVRWWRDLARLGVNLPLFVVHDIGHLVATPRDRVDFTPRSGAESTLANAKLAPSAASYRALVLDLADSQAASIARTMKLPDDLVVTVLGRILAALVRDALPPPGWPVTLPIDAELLRDLDAQLPALFAATPRAYETTFLTVLTHSRLRVLTLADTIDVDTLRILGMLGGSESGAAGALAQVDLLAAMSSPSSSDIVSLSLELLPQVLESRRAHAPSIHAANGYGGVGREGSVDSMALTELTWDEEELERRMLDGELLFYSREQAPQAPRRMHHCVVDASASMRGQREVFARGLAIALGKKLELGGDAVRMRFFDSRIYDSPRASGRSSLPVAWLLGFRGERGRNPARVFAQLATEMALLRARDPSDHVIHLITHAALHVPRHLVEEVRRHAHLFAVFILPSGGALHLDWLDLLEGHAVVDHATLQERGSRAAAAKRIVERA